MTETHELAVMCDTFHPLKLTALAKDRGSGLRVLLVRGAGRGQGSEERRRGSRRSDLALLSGRTIAVDFDGTVTEMDLLDTIARDFGDPRSTQEVDHGLDEGNLPLREVITREFEPVRRRSTRSSSGSSTTCACATASATSSTSRESRAGASSSSRAASTS